MNKYAKAAIIAAHALNTKDAIEAWEFAVTEVFPNSKDSQKKSCPRSTFLGLCEEGFITNSKPGNYTNSIDNKNYAISAVKILKEGTVISNKNQLWQLVMIDKLKKHNSQMDIVLELWNNGFIK